MIEQYRNLKHDLAVARGRAPAPEPVEDDSRLDRTGILEHAADLITGDRAEAYGDFGEQMLALSRAFEAITGYALSPQHVGVLLMLLKLRRAQSSPDQDNLTDLCGYAALYAETFK